jgi:hypothetical protein
LLERATRAGSGERYLLCVASMLKGKQPGTQAWRFWLVLLLGQMQGLTVQAALTCHCVGRECSSQEGPKEEV